MRTIKELERTGEKAIRTLRRNKLINGIPFMINISSLPCYQYYREYPDGKINLEAICSDTNGFKVIKKLSKKENELIRKKLRLEKIYK